MLNTIRDVLNIGADFLKKSGIDSNRIDSRIIASKAFSMPMTDIIMKGDLVVSESDFKIFMELIRRRASHEPIAYMLDKKEFYGIEFYVDQNVLIPRPDSEVIIEEVLRRYDRKQAINILELGVGSGCLLLTILKHMPNASATAVDIEPGAIKIAKQNYYSLKLKNKVEFLEMDWKMMGIDKKFDLIISNPPYIKDSDIDLLQKDVKDYEPITALSGGEDGLDAYREIARLLSNIMHKNSVVILECGENQHIDVANIMEIDNIYIKEYLKDLSNRTRCIVLEAR